MKQTILIIAFLFSIKAIAQETPWAGISYSTVIADKVKTENNDILNNSKSWSSNFTVHGMYGDSISKNWIAYGGLRYSHLKTSTDISETDKATLIGEVPELSYSTYNENHYEISLGGIRNFGKRISLILNNSFIYTKYNYSSFGVKSYEYQFVGYGNFNFKKYFNIGVGGLYYTNFHINTVIPILAFGLNFKKLSIDANLPLNLGITYRLTDKLSITGNGNLSFGTLQIPDDSPDYALAKEMGMIDIGTTLGVQYKIKKVLLFTNLGVKYIEKTYTGTNNLNMIYPENLYLEFGLSLLD